MAKEGTITPVELISTASRGEYGGIDGASAAENAARGDQIDSQLRATIAEGAEAEQREERQRKCAEQGLVYSETVGSCLDPELNDLISGNINPASNDIPNGNITFEDLTLGADASITGTKAIEDYLTTLANDAAFGDLVQSAGIASSIAGNNAANVVQTPGFAPLETAGAAVETIGNMQIPGVLDIPGVGPVIEQGAETLAGFIDDIVDLTGVFRGWGKDVVLAPGGAKVTVRPPNTRPATQPGGGPQVGSAGNTTVTIDTGSPEGNVIAQGGSVAGIADVLSGGSGEGTITQSEIIMRAACAAQGKEYSPYSNMCVSKKPDAPTNTPGINPNPGGIIPAGTGTTPPAGAGTGNEDTESTGANTTVSVATTSKHPCEDPAYAGNPRNFVECAAYMATKDNDTPAPPTAGITVVGPGGDGAAPAGGVGPVPTAVDPCDKPEYAAANPAICGGTGPGPDPDPDCNDPDYAAANPVECGGIGPDSETPPVVPPVVDPCDDPDYAAANPVKCGNASIGPETPSVVPPVVDPCNDPDYAAVNPAICGGTGIANPCDDLDYAAANPEQCGGGLNFCDDPDYAAANPEECGGGLTLCGDEVFAMLNPDICNAAPGFTMPGGGGGSYISVTPGEVADIGYYDVNTPSGVFGNKGSGNLVSEIEAILKGR